MLVVILAGIAIACAGYLIWYYGTSRQTEEIPEPIVEETTKPVIEITAEEPVEELVEIPIDFASLEAVNSDVYAWIRINDTIIDYPVVQSLTNDNYYLNRSWDNKHSSAGAIFSQAYNSQDFTDFNTVIYGHQMGAGVETMFHQLTNYLDADFMDSHREIIIYTPNKILTYKVFAAYLYDDRHLMNSFDFSNREVYSNYLSEIQTMDSEEINIRKEIQVTDADKIITLITCIREEPEKRVYVQAVLESYDL